MTFFTSDLHFFDPRLELTGRNLFANSSGKIDEMLIENWNARVNATDIVFVLGDVCFFNFTDDIDKTTNDPIDFKLDILNQLNGEKVLIKGNYDDGVSNETWLKYFKKVCDGCFITIGKEKVYLTHYPLKAREDCFNLVGHVHGTWRVQRNMLNVSTDAWNFVPIDLDTVKFFMNAIRKYYDKNIFAGELECNLKWSK